MNATTLQPIERCLCASKHRTRQSFLQCAMRDRYTRVNGSGRYAAVCIKQYANGRGGTTRHPIVHLFETPEGVEAYGRAAFDSGHQCSGTCVLHHLLLALPDHLR